MVSKLGQPEKYWNLLLMNKVTPICNFYINSCVTFVTFLKNHSARGSYLLNILNITEKPYWTC